MINPNYHREISTTKMKLLQYKSLGFFAFLMFNLKILPDEKIETIKTNGVDIFINPDWFLSLTPDLRVYSLMHVTMHIALSFVEVGIIPFMCVATTIYFFYVVGVLIFPVHLCLLLTSKYFDVAIFSVI